MSSVYHHRCWQGGHRPRHHRRRRRSRTECALRIAIRHRMRWRWRRAGRRALARSSHISSPAGEGESSLRRLARPPQCRQPPAARPSSHHGTRPSREFPIGPSAQNLKRGLGELSPKISPEPQTKHQGRQILKPCSPTNSRIHCSRRTGIEAEETHRNLLAVVAVSARIHRSAESRYFRP